MLQHLSDRSRSTGTKQLLQSTEMSQPGVRPRARSWKGRPYPRGAWTAALKLIKGTRFKTHPISDKDLQSQSSNKGSLNTFPAQVTDGRTVLRRWLETHHCSHPLHLEKECPLRMSFSFRYLRKNNLTCFTRPDLHKHYHPTDFNISQYC